MNTVYFYLSDKSVFIELQRYVMFSEAISLNFYYFSTDVLNQ